jgi:hypothetical protein
MRDVIIDCRFQITDCRARDRRKAIDNCQPSSNRATAKHQLPNGQGWFLGCLVPWLLATRGVCAER